MLRKFLHHYAVIADDADNIDTCCPARNVNFDLWGIGFLAEEYAAGGIIYGHIGNRIGRILSLQRKGVRDRVGIERNTIFDVIVVNASNHMHSLASRGGAALLCGSCHGVSGCGSGCNGDRSGGLASTPHVSVGPAGCQCGAFAYSNLSIA